MSIPLFLVRWLARSGLARFLPSVQRLTDGGGAFVRYLSDRVLGAPYRELLEAAPLLEPHGPDAIDLGVGSPRFDLAPSGGTKLPADRRGWPPVWGLPELRVAVTEYLRVQQALAVSPIDEVLITPGAAGAFHLALDTFLNPDDQVVLFAPTSPLYALACRYRRAKVHWVPTWMEEGRTRFHFEPLVKALRRARLLVVNSPANPTGGCLAAEDLEQLAWWADRKDVLIANDEVFERYRYEGPEFSIGALLKARRRTLTIGSLSKGHALASARVGWLAGHRHLIRACALSAGLQTAWVPTLCQQVALTAFQQGSEAFEPIKSEFQSRRQYAFERLEAMDLKPVWPAGGFFFWVPVHQLGVTGAAFAERLLHAQKVLVWPGNLFGPGGAGYVRVSYAAEDGRLREDLTRLAEFVRQARTSGPAEPKQAA